MLTALTLALCVGGVHSAGRQLEHASTLLTSGSPSLFTVPELRTPRPGHAKLEAMEAEHGAAHSPAAVHGFLGETAVGFVDYTVSAWPKHTTIFTEDYPEAMAAATFACQPVAAGQAPYVDEEDKTVRNEVQVSINFAGAATVPGLARLLRVAQVPGAAIVFDLELLALHAEFAAGTQCAAQIPHTATAYAIDNAEATDASLTLTLRPVEVAAVHNYMDLTMHYTPNAEAEVQRRRAEGLPTGGKSRRMAITAAQTTPIPMNVNWDGSNVVTSNIEFTSTYPGLLQCKNCHSSMSATYSFTLQFCLFQGTGGTAAIAASGGTPASPAVAATLTFWLTTNSDGCIGSACGASGSANPIVPQTTVNMADCLSAPWVNSPATTVPNLAVVLPTTQINDARLYLNVEAYVSGNLNSYITLSSQGFVGGAASTSGAVCLNPTVAGDSSTCQNKVPLVSSYYNPSGLLSTISLGSGVTVTVSGKMEGTALFTNALSGGVYYGFNMSASNARLGGKLASNNNNFPAFTPTSYNFVPAVYTAAPFGVLLQSLPANAAPTTIDTTIWITNTLKVGDIATFTSVNQHQMSAAFTVGTRASLRGLETYGGRMLQNSVATCPAATSFIAAVTQKPTTTTLFVTMPSYAALGAMFTTPANLLIATVANPFNDLQYIIPLAASGMLTNAASTLSATSATVASVSTAAQAAASLPFYASELARLAKAFYDDATSGLATFINTPAVASTSATSVADKYSFALVSAVATSYLASVKESFKAELDIKYGILLTAATNLNAAKIAAASSSYATTLSTAQATFVAAYKAFINVIPTTSPVTVTVNTLTLTTPLIAACIPSRTTFTGVAAVGLPVVTATTVITSTPAATTTTDSSWNLSTILGLALGLGIPLFLIIIYGSIQLFKHKPAAPAKQSAPISRSSPVQGAEAAALQRVEHAQEVLGGLHAELSNSGRAQLPPPPPPPPANSSPTLLRVQQAQEVLGSLHAELSASARQLTPSAPGLYSETAFRSLGAAPQLSASGRQQAPPSPSSRAPEPTAATTQEEEEAAVVKQLPPAAYRMLREKGAISVFGKFVTSVTLTNEEEELIGSTELIIKLAALGMAANMGSAGASASSATRGAAGRN